MAAKKKVIKVLKDALAAMNDKGRHWTQGAVRDLDTGEARFCSLGALYYVTGADMDALDNDDVAALDTGEVEVRKEAIAALAAVLPPMPYTPASDFHAQQHIITSWNDDMRRTWDEVVEAFERAEKRVEAAASK